MGEATSRCALIIATWTKNSMEGGFHDRGEGLRSAVGVEERTSVRKFRIGERDRRRRRIQGKSWSNMGIVNWLSGDGTRAKPTHLRRVVEENDWRI